MRQKIWVLVLLATVCTVFKFDEVAFADRISYEESGLQFLVDIRSLTVSRSSVNVDFRSVKGTLEYVFLQYSPENYHGGRISFNIGGELTPPVSEVDMKGNRTSVTKPNFDFSLSTLSSTLYGDWKGEELLVTKVNGYFSGTFSFDGTVWNTYNEHEIPSRGTKGWAAIVSVPIKWKSSASPVNGFIVPLSIESPSFPEPTSILMIAIGGFALIRQPKRL